MRCMQNDVHSFSSVRHRIIADQMMTMALSSTEHGDFGGSRGAIVSTAAAAIAAVDAAAVTSFTTTMTALLLL